MRKSLDADVSAHLVTPVKISLLEQTTGFAFNLDRIRASPEATPGELLVMRRLALSRTRTGVFGPEGAC